MKRKKKFSTSKEDQEIGVVWVINNDVSPNNSEIPLQEHLLSFHRLDPRYELAVDPERHTIADHLNQYRDDFW